MKLHAHSPLRETAKAILVHPLENALLVAVAIHLIFLPWALGTMRLWAQLISLTLSTLTFALALLPRHYTTDHTGGAPYRYLPWRKLFRFPIFWLGLALLGLIVCQGLNPAWEYQTNGKGWWMRAIPHITWLPHGVRAPFEIYGPWRVLIIYASAFLTVCSIWIGFTRRRTLKRFFFILAANGAALAVLGLAQRFSGTGKIFWSVTSPNPAFFASFIYKNHAGGYLLLSLAVICALGAWYYIRSVRRMEKSSPSIIFGFLALCIAISILVSFARGATLVALGYMAVLVVAYLVHQFRLPPHARKTAVALTLAVTFGLFVNVGLTALDSEVAWGRIRQALSGQDLSVRARQFANEATSDALKDNWVSGIGSGSFRFLFPTYQQHHPETLYFAGTQARMYWENAHNDILQFPLELGLLGMLLLAAGFAFWTLALFRNHGFRNPLSIWAIVGAVFLIGMSWGEFVFQNPAILITWCALWPAATLWAEAEYKKLKR